MKKIILISAVALLVSFAGTAQENPIRIGVKLGKPNIAGLNAEYALPFIGGRLAPAIDFSTLSVPTSLLDNPEVTYNYFGFGANFYFLGDGKGPYAHLGYGKIGVDAKYTSNGETADIDFDANLFIAKLGIRKGKRFYFISELGWGLTSADPEVVVQYDTFSETKKIPGFLVGGFIANTGFGVAF